MERRMNGGWGRRGTRGKRNNERDAYVSFLIVTGSTLRYRPREARPCHYYPIISCITVTVNEVSYYAARRGGGWKKRGERRPYVSWGEKGKRARRGSMSLRWKKKKKKKKDIHHLQFTPFITDANLDLDWEKIRWSSWIYYTPLLGPRSVQISLFQNFNRGKDCLFRILGAKIELTRIKCSSLKAYIFLRWLNFIVPSNDPKNGTSISRTMNRYLIWSLKSWRRRNLMRH